MNEYTWIDDICVCDNCGSFALSEEAIVHHETCQPGESKKWEQFYNEKETNKPQDSYLLVGKEAADIMEKHIEDIRREEE